MNNTYVKNLIADSRKKIDDFTFTNSDYIDTLPFSSFLLKVDLSALRDENFNFEEVSDLCANLYRLFLTIDKLGGLVNKDVVKLIVQLKKFTSRETSEKGISLVQSMLDYMITKFLDNTLTAKPADPETNKTIVFDKDDEGKEYTDKYFSFGHNGKRYIVKTDSFDLSDILKQL